MEMRGYLVWQNHFQIPDVPPNPLAGCKIMELQYYLEVNFLACLKVKDYCFDIPHYNFDSFMALDKAGDGKVE